MSEFLLSTLTSFGALIPVTLAQGLILSFVSLALMLPFRVLNFADMSCEGAFPLGACVCVAVMNGGGSAPFAAVAGMLSGFVAGCITAFVHVRFRIHSLLAGILVTTMIYSLNLRIMGRANLSVFGQTTLYDYWPLASLVVDGDATRARIALAGGVALIVLFVLWRLFRTEQGIAMRCVGANPTMAQAQGIPVWAYTIAGVGLANALAASSGVLMAQSQGFADVNMGLGVMVNGLAGLMIGEALVGTRGMGRQLTAPFVGAVAYYLAVSLLLAAGMPPPDLKLITGLFVLAMLVAPTLRNRRRP